jgi:protocatechuate 3,4-dioxygenase alpha subunit
MSGAATLKSTPSQTVGPFFAPALLREPLNNLVGGDPAGERIRIEGRVIDGDGQPVADAMIEIWQANSHGRYNHPLDQRDLPLDPAFTGFGRAGSDDEGRFWFETVKPGPVPFDAERMQAPHLSVTVMSRGMLNHAITRLYFADDPANETDPVLGLVPASRRGTLLAQRDDADGSVVYRLDIVLQGRGETVFFNV